MGNENVVLQSDRETRRSSNSRPGINVDDKSAEELRSWKKKYAAAMGTGAAAGAAMGAFAGGIGAVPGAVIGAGVGLGTEILTSLPADTVSLTLGKFWRSLKEDMGSSDE